MKMIVIKRVLIVMLFLSLSYLVYSVRFREKDKAFAAMVAGKASFAESSLEHRDLSPKRSQGYEEFLKEVEKKNLFSLPKVKTLKGPAKVDRAKLERVIKNLRLVGILKQGVVKAIIEDSLKDSIFCLAEKESFLDDISVESIDKNRVILHYQGERFELSF